MGDGIDVTVDAGISPEQRQAVEAVFQGAGQRANVHDDYLRFGGDALPWAVFVLTPLAWLALQFASGAVHKAGEDAWDAYRGGGWRGLRRFINEVVRAREGVRGGTITIRDPTGPDVDLSATIPDEALKSLGDLDWAAMQGGRLSWRASTGDWMYLGGEGHP